MIAGLFDGSGFGELVSARSYCDDVLRVVRIVFDLGAEVCDMHFYEVKAVLVVGPNSPPQLFASEDLSRRSHQNGEQSEFVGGQSHVSIFYFSSARGQVQLNVSRVKNAVRLGGRIVGWRDVSDHRVSHDSSQDCLRTYRQGADAQRGWNIVFRARFKRGGEVVFRVVPIEEDNRRSAVSADILAEVE